MLRDVNVNGKQICQDKQASIDPRYYSADELYSESFNDIPGPLQAIIARVEREIYKVSLGPPELAEHTTPDR